jgi:hydrogenase/urease accessory protein HupE
MRIVWPSTRSVWHSTAWLIVLLWCHVALAHKGSDSFVHLDQQGSEITARVDIAVRDLTRVVALDRNNDGSIQWSEVLASRVAIESYLDAHFAIHANESTCMRNPGIELLAVEHSDGTYVVLSARYRCPNESGQMHLDDTFLFERDTQHRGIASAITDSGERSTVILPSAHRWTFHDSSKRASPRIDAASKMLHEGVRHILDGLDHLLFLLVLLLPAVRPHTGERRLREVLLDVAKVATAFTVAHSVTLSLSALGWVELPSRLVESLIAASVALAAINNIFPAVSMDRWPMAFSLGLLHGFGIASTLDDANLRPGLKLASLFGFNLGVEAGQLLCILIAIPVLFAIRNWKHYATWVVRGGSALVLLLALVWLAERSLAVKLLPQLLQRDESILHLLCHRLVHSS